MLQLLWPYALALLPLPALLRIWLPASTNSTQAMRLPMYTLLNQIQGSESSTKSSHWQSGSLLWLCWLGLVLAISRPVWIGEPILIPQDKRDMLLAVDISESMLEDDMLEGREYISRVAAVKSVVSEFVKKRDSDRLGLILFGQQAYLQTPLTFDRNTVQTQLLEARVGFAGNATAIGDSIGIAIKRLRNRPAENRVLVLLTDGQNTAGTEPLAAAKVAAEAGIRIHTIGIGASAKQQRDFFGRIRTTNPSAGLDEQTLDKIAKRTGGKYFRAEDPAQLAAVYEALDELEPTPQDLSYRPLRSLIHWPLGALLASCALLLWLQKSRHGRDQGRNKS